MKTNTAETQSAPPAPPAPTRTEPKKALKSIKHSYTPSERQNLGEEMARQVNELCAIESEFEQVKAQYKSRQTAAQALINRCASALTSGFEFRAVPHVLFIDVKRRRRVWFPQADVDADNGLLDRVGKWSQIDWEEGCQAYGGIVEEMRPEDLQTELPIAQKGGDK